MDKRQEIRSQVKGFLVPIFMQDDPATGRRMNGLSPRDFEKVKAGFACAECLAEFDHYTITCPVCGRTRDFARDVQEAPQLWKDHLRDHYEDRTPYTRMRRNPLEEGSLMPSDEVEQVSVTKLRTRKFGRGA